MLPDDDDYSFPEKVLYIVSGVLGVLALLGVIAIAVVLGSKIAQGQEFPERRHVPSDPDHWYPTECCDLRDCRPARPGEVTYRSDLKMYVVNVEGMPQPELVPADQVRRAEVPHDEEDLHHICIRQYMRIDERQTMHVELIWAENPESGVSYPCLFERPNGY